MPIYDYRCKNCGHVFEKLYFSFKEAEVAPRKTRCPECEGIGEKVFSSAPAVMGRESSEDSEEYREMHYYEKKRDWEKAAKAAEGVSELARNEFLKRARQERSE